MNNNKVKIILFCLLFSVFLKAQKLSSDSAFVSFDCGIVQNKQKLDREFFASTPPLQLRANNEELTYSTIQLGKRKNKIFLYLQIIAKNVCIKKDKNVDIYFKSGEIITLKNEYPLNCEGFFAKQLTKKELEKLRGNEITLIKVYTYKKNYEYYVSDTDNTNFDNQIDCLSAYGVKKTDQVKIKKQKENVSSSGT
ncbi:hypothetical protein SAMN05421664_0859 [Chryseobacterium soldanellicola]|uniref:Uncharacterized protein n=1 Tax=Chryseobacterium soldanellicola TaxID=311333 RepID=A0A1H0YPG4_9FLAO|nr:hypothetical protein [Chryseobacterium soldanellicola]SDQ17020.1 hypothetical protein SAMN05421664_0859 [Chryseobacterium soldanellicola]